MFTENMIQYGNTGNIGICPNCGHNLKINKIETPIRDNYTVICPVCEKTEYFTGTTKA